MLKIDLLKGFVLSPSRGVWIDSEVVLMQKDSFSSCRRCDVDGVVVIGSCALRLAVLAKALAVILPLTRHCIIRGSFHTGTGRTEALSCPRATGD